LQSCIELYFDDALCEEYLNRYATGNGGHGSSASEAGISETKRRGSRWCGLGMLVGEG
jgi:hypothetical protein